MYRRLCATCRVRQQVSSPRIFTMSSAPITGVGLFATKPISDYQAEASSKHLVRALGIPSLVAFGIGGIIGTGIFVLTGLAAATHAGPAIVISFVIAGIGCMFAGLCYSEFAAMVPVAGSAYAYSYATLGKWSPGSSDGI